MNIKKCQQQNTFLKWNNDHKLRGEMHGGVVINLTIALNLQ